MWSKEIPLESGYYFVRWPADLVGQEEPFIVELYYKNGECFALITGISGKQSLDPQTSELRNYEWSKRVIPPL